MNDFNAHPLSACECCPRKCGSNRLDGETGFCGAGSGIRVSHAGLHFGEEPPISGTRGSGTVFFWGCNLRCAFCQNHQISQGPWRDGEAELSPEGLARQMMRLEEDGAHNINFVSPSHMAFQMAEAIIRARALGLTLPTVYNSNGYDSVESLRSLKGLVDIYLPDLKYMRNDLGKQLSGVENYADKAPGAIVEMYNQVGALEIRPEGVATRGLLVRHLVLPGQLDNSRECLSFLSGVDPNLAISVMSQYSPRHMAQLHPGLDRVLSRDEYEEIVDCALEYGLKNAFVQEIESQSNYLPDFGRDLPFGPAPSGESL